MSIDQVVPVEQEMMQIIIRREDAERVTKCVDLYRAAKNGDWQSAMNNPNITRKITNKHETCLHISAAYKQRGFAGELVSYVQKSFNYDPEALKRFLETQNSSGNTALCYAAFTGQLEMAMLMVDKYMGLPDLGNSKPVLVAASYGHKKMVLYLLDNTLLPDLSEQDRHELFLGIIRMGLYDEALNMLGDTVANGDNDTDAALFLLARTPSAFVHEKDPPLWRKFINFSSGTSTADRSGVIRLVNKLIDIVTSRCQDTEANVNQEPVIISQTLLLAAQEGNTELVIHLLQSDPGLIWKVLDINRSIFHIAIEKRHESIFTLIHEFGALKNLIVQNEVDGGNNMLHLAAKLAPQSKLNQVSGAALQMQREMLWFEEVKKIVPQEFIHKENSECKTPQILFNENHKELRQAGEKWMKDTAHSCMVVATLIATVTFAAIFSAPGGFRNDSGNPSLQNHECFWIFSMSNATAWFSSVFSMIMFLFILTSRYAEEDFLYSLPTKLTLGVGSLLVSVGSMMVAFCATFLLYYPLGFGWLISSLLVFPLLPLVYVPVRYPVLFDHIFSALLSHRMFAWPKRLH